MNRRFYEQCEAATFLVVLAAGILEIAAGCGAALGTPEESLSPSVPKTVQESSEKQRPGSWEIEYVKTGGFAGIQRQLRLSSKGNLIATDMKKNRSIEQHVSSEQLTEITSMLKKLDFSRKPEGDSKFSNRCRDCFLHTLTVVMDGQEHRRRFDDLSLRDSEYAPLIRLLSSLLNQALQNKNVDQ